MTIKIVISTCHTAAANTLLLLLPPPRCCHISKRAAATAKIALPPSYYLRRQAGCHHHAAAAASFPTTLPMMCYHCLQNIKKCNTIDYPFFTTMVTAAHSDNNRNQLTCIEKDKPKKNNKIIQHEKNKPNFQFLLSFSLVQPLFCSNNHHCDCHRHPLQRPLAMHAASPLAPLPPSPVNYHRHCDD
jgi:hypothetical protein